ncbi:hypothetical protein [Thiocapsa sp. N5-Cardenillas]|uniref:hypothetical protein n=1 Tax=Thiocapsa sp. N5-Cardenillas TaxID=3137397 RepID=UPI0035AFECF9
MITVYRTPGDRRHPTRGFLYAQKVVAPDDLDAAIADGWNPDFDAACGLAAPVADPEPEQVAADDDAPPTRDELLAKAAELGLAVDKRWGDARLAAAVAEAVALRMEMGK